MIRALIIKELRECLPLMAIATLAAAWALLVHTSGRLVPWGYSTGGEPRPFLGGDGLVRGMLPLITGGFALVLGMKQALWEELRGTYHYLLHRPATRTQLFLLKAAVGAALVQLVGAAMILIYGAWAATPGMHASPFFWSMTLPAWQTWSVMPVVYLGAMLSGLRPARWYGTRLLPLAGCVFLALILGLQPRLWVTVVGAVAIGAATLLCVINVARTRDY